MKTCYCVRLLTAPACDSGMEATVAAGFDADVVDEALQTSKRLALGGDGSEFAGVAGVRQRRGGSASATIVESNECAKRRGVIVCGMRAIWRGRGELIACARVADGFHKLAGSEPRSDPQYALSHRKRQAHAVLARVSLDHLPQALHAASFTGFAEDRFIISENAWYLTLIIGKHTIQTHHHEPYPPNYGPCTSLGAQQNVRRTMSRHRWTSTRRQLVLRGSPSHHISQH